MGSNFKQIRSEDRIAIVHLLKAGIGKAQIADQLGFHRSTIYREIARNSSRLGYLPLIAERKINERRKRAVKLNQDKELRNYVFDKLQLSWSPEQIAGRLKLENGGESVICHETIYAYLYSDYGIRNKYYHYLRQKRRFRYPKISRKRRSLIQNRVSIKERPAEINARSSIGHWECDLMHFGIKTKTNLITLRERCSRYMLAIKNPNKKPKETAEKIIKKLGVFSDHCVKTITFDNGLEFSHHEKIGSELNSKTYFCEPYKSYQKGTVENGNKQLREWLPKDAIINNISQYEISMRVKLLNSRPMKCLGYLTPKEVFIRKCKPFLQCVSAIF